MPGARRIAILKALDEWGGSIAARLVPKAARIEPLAHPPEHVLVVKFWGMGSLILARPALAHLRAVWPSARIDLLTLQENLELARMIPELDSAHALSLRSWSRALLRLGSLSRLLRRSRYDLALDLEFFAHAGALLLASAGVPRRLGFARRRGGKQRLLHQVVPFRSDLHAAENFLALAKAATGESTSAAVAPRPLGGRLSPRGAYLVVNVNAGALAYERRWPREHFIELARRLLDAFPLELVLTGSHQEVDYVGSIEKALASSSRVRNLAGKQSIEELAACLSGARAVVSSDSGPAHLAAALGRPVVVFFGPESPARYAPLGPDVHVVYGARFCSPCMTIENAKTVRCPYRAACMRELEPVRVWPAIAEFLTKHVGA